MAIANTTIQIRKSTTSGNTPVSLANGELAINSADGKLFYRTPVGGIASITNQQSFATINANSSLILAGSGSDTLSVVPGNNISISTNTTTKTITINSTASGGGVFNYFQNTAPTTANSHDYWTNSDTGVMYENFGTPSSPVWAEVGPTGTSYINLTDVVANTISVPGYATVVNNSSTDKYINVGTHGQIFDDGNFHLHTSSGNLWLNSLDGGDINLGLQSNSGTSKAVAKNLSLDAGYGSTAPIYGVRAWINCGYNGSTMVTRANGNISVTRAGVGVYNFTFNTPLPDGNYAVNATVQTPGANSDAAVNITYGTTPANTGFSLTVARYGNGNEDTPILHVQVVR